MIDVVIRTQQRTKTQLHFVSKYNCNFGIIFACERLLKKLTNIQIYTFSPGLVKYVNAGDNVVSGGIVAGLGCDDISGFGGLVVELHCWAFPS